MKENNYRHFFLNEENYLERLENYFKRDGKIILAFDFDDTVYDCRNYGRDYTELIELVKAMRPYSYLIVFTARPENEYDKVREFLAKENIPFDAINEDAPWTPMERRCRKVYYQVLLDDKAGLLMPYRALTQFLENRKKEETLEIESA